jgi:tetratricopeptide (TPR) repeat protein
MAFDSGEPVENANYLSSESLEVMSRGGHAWIPVETTVLSQGFMAAWASASSLVRAYASSGTFEFIPLSDMRDSYPALPLPPSSITVAEPAKAGVDRVYSASLSVFTASLYSDKRKGLEGRLSALSGRQAVRVRVQEGVLHAIFGRMTEAEGAFRTAIAEDPGLVSPYVNLANIRLLANDGSGALQVVKQGLAKNASSALLNLIAARVYADRKDAANAAAHFAKVQSAAPELAARYPELAEIGEHRTANTGGTGGTEPQRAAQAGEKPSVIWGTDQ